MDANKATLADLLRTLDIKYLDTGEPHTFKLRPNGECEVKRDGQE